MARDQVLTLSFDDELVTREWVLANFYAIYSGTPVPLDATQPGYEKWKLNREP